MRLVKFRTEDGTRAGRLDGDRVVELEDSDVSALLARGYAAVVAATTATGAEHAYSDLDLAPVLPDPAEDHLRRAELPRPHPRAGVSGGGRSELG